MDRTRIWNERVSEYLAEIVGVTNATLRQYETRLRLMPAWFVRLGREVPLIQHLSAGDVSAIAHDVSMAATTRVTALVVLRAFARWAKTPIAEDRRAWRGPKYVPTRPRHANADELRTLLESANRPALRAAIALMGYNGLRAGEVAHARVADLVPTGKGWALRIPSGKGDKPRVVPLARQTVDALVPLTVARQPTDTFWPAHQTRIREGLRELCRRIGLRHLSPHDLRHGFGREYLRAGGSMVSLQRIYGHANLSQTAAYVAGDAEEAEIGMDAFSASMKVPPVTVRALEAQ